MSKAKSKPKLVPFDAAKYLTDEEAVAEYMNAVLEAEDPDLLLLALGDVARARGMAQVAKAPVLPHVILLPDASPTMLPAGPDVPRDHAAAPEPTS